jgi:hypothetical protein
VFPAYGWEVRLFPQWLLHVIARGKHAADFKYQDSSEGLSRLGFSPPKHLFILRQEATVLIW